MTPFLADQDFTLYVGDAAEVLAGLPAESVHCVVTSPPYWGLRDYGTEGQLGLEPTPEEYVSNMVAVFREVRRVLRRDGTCWLNIGDSYWNGGGEKRDGGHGFVDGGKRKLEAAKGALLQAPATTDLGLKPKDLVGIPWRLAFALQADGWYLRSDIIWSKPNPMPESVTDRPTKAHEFVFLLTKGEWKGPAKGRFCDLSESDKRWLALLVDAEGNICVKRVAPKEGKSPQYGAQVAIGSTSRALLDRVQQITGCGNVNERPGTNAPMFYWQASNKVARDLLYAIYPHLIVKPRQARIAMHLESLLYHRGNATMRTGRENAALESLWTRNKDCNQFGDPDLSDVPEPRYGRWGPTKYHYDADAIREPAEWARWGDQTNGKHEGQGSAAGWIGSKSKDELQGKYANPGNRTTNGPRSTERRHETAGFSQRLVSADGGKNKRTVWEIATEPYPDAHFATFPQALVEPCVLAGTSERGCCPVCGAPWERETESLGPSKPNAHERTLKAGNQPREGGNSGLAAAQMGSQWIRNTIGWRPTCECGRPDVVPATVCDIFMGSGTTALVARRLGRRTIGIELSAEYATLAATRLQQLSLLAGGAA